MSRVREKHRGRRKALPRPTIGTPAGSRTRISGLVAVTELAEHLDVIGRLDAAIGPIKTRDRGAAAGQVLVGMAAAQLAGEGFLAALDRHRADAAGQLLIPVPGLASTAAAASAAVSLLDPDDDRQLQVLPEWGAPRATVSSMPITASGVCPTCS